MGWQKSLGAGACLVLIASCFMHWCYYPGPNEFFTGFHSYKNYYGKPGVLITIFATVAFFMHLTSKTWAKGVNLGIAALCTAYAVKSFYVYVAPYDGVYPEKQFGIWVMLLAIITNFVAVVFARSEDIPTEKVEEIKTDLPAV